MDIRDPELKYDVTKFLCYYNDGLQGSPFSTIAGEGGENLFRPVTSGVAHFGITRDVYWFRLDLLNSSSRTEWFLEAGVPTLNSIIVLSDNGSGGADTLMDAGTNTPGIRFLQDRTSFNCRIMLEPGKVRRLFIRIQTSSYLVLPVRIVTPEAMLEHRLQTNRFLFGLYGILLAALFFNLILLAITRERNYLFLLLLLLLAGIASAYQYGIEAIPFLDTVQKSRIRAILFSIVLINFNLFTIRYLDLNRFPTLHKAFRGLLAFLCLQCVLTLLPFVPVRLLHFVNPYIAIVMGIAIMVTSAGLIRKQRTAIFLLIYTAIFLVSSVVFLLMLHGIIPVNLATFHISLLSVSVVSILLSLGLIEKLGQIHELQLAEKRVREVSETKDRFFSVIGHDLMNPVNALSGFSGLMLDAVRSGDRESGLRYANTVNQLVQRLTDLLQSVLLWSKAQRGQLEPQPNLVNIRALALESVSHMVPVAEEKHITLHIGITENCNGFTDYQILSAVIRNLAWNTIKLTENGGTITITAAIDGPDLRVAVEDTSLLPGREKVPGIFPSAGNKAPKEPAGTLGTGLGLVMARDLIELLGGAVIAESAPGIRPRFTFTVPADCRNKNEFSALNTGQYPPS